MLGYITVGADDLVLADRFYSAFLPALGYEFGEDAQGLSYSPPKMPNQSPALPEFYVAPPFNGQPATNGNGTMIAFHARSKKQVRDLHAAALAAGGKMQFNLVSQPLGPALLI